MLVDELGVNRFSLYAEFENKQKLFNATLERYEQKVVERKFSPLEASDAGIKELRTLLDFFASAINGPTAGRGCLLCNTAVEFGPEDPGGALSQVCRCRDTALSDQQCNALYYARLPSRRDRAHCPTSAGGQGATHHGQAQSYFAGPGEGVTHPPRCTWL